MSALGKIAGQVALYQFMNGNTLTTRRVSLMPSLVSIAGFLACVGLLLIMFAAHLWFDANFPPEQAWLLSGLSFLALSLVVVLISFCIALYKRRQITKVKDDVEEAIFDFVDTLDEEFSAQIRQNPKTAVIIAALAGYIAGDKLL